jgi:formiminoglutamase
MLSQDELLTLTERPQTELFFSRHDAHDPRLGERVAHSRADYDDAQVVILGCPQDEGVRRNGGRAGAAQAPDEIRRCFYKLTVNRLEHLRLFDIGSTIIQPTLEATHDRQRAIVERILSDGKTLIVLGGGNDLSYPDCGGLAQVAYPVVAVNVDAHFDVRADALPNSGTPYRQLLEDGAVFPECLYEMCSHPFANSPIYEAYLREKGAHIIPLAAVRADGIDMSFTRILRQHPDAHFFWGLDMDVVRASDAPGVSAPNPIGLAGDELCAIAALAGGHAGSRVLEITEVNPVYDIDQRTCRLAAVVLYSFLSAR